MEDLRTNVGFIIIASERIDRQTEVVMGFNPRTSQYVTWLCHEGTNYSYGHYGDDFIITAEDFRRRVRKRLAV